MGETWEGISLVCVNVLALSPKRDQRSVTPIYNLWLSFFVIFYCLSLSVLLTDELSYVLSPSITLQITPALAKQSRKYTSDEVSWNGAALRINYREFSLLSSMSCSHVN